MAPLLGETIVFRHPFEDGARRHPVAFCLSRCTPAALEAARHRFLTPGEEALWGRLTSEPRRASRLLGRYCAKEAVAAFRGGVGLPDFEIDTGLFQQPVVRGAGTGGVQVSLAHSEGWGVAMAFDEGHPAGIDLERVDPQRLAVVEEQLTGREAADLAAAPGELPVRLGLLWTAKEALSKALRTGLTAPLGLFEITRASWDAGGLACEFVAFSQYRAVSFELAGFILGLAFPRMSAPVGSLRAFREQFRFDDPGRGAVATDARATRLR